LTLLVFFLMLGIVIFASLVYYGERLQANPHNDFKVKMSSFQHFVGALVISRHIKYSTLIFTSCAEYSGRPLVGDRNHDNGRLRRHGA
jgi:hypothetical protein